MAIIWDTLKNNKQGKGFENLAIEYLKDNFPGNWEQTQATRDGNKDAVSIVYLNKENWAEAKYTKKKKLSRYRLDATIVSAIIHNNVMSIVFITNSQIENKIQDNIKIALNNAMGDKFKVYFRTKNDIEYWLCNNPKIFNKYFTDSKNQLKSLKNSFKNIKITNDISFYRVIKQSISYCEALDSLVLGENYNMTFSVFSPKNEKVHINVHNPIISLNDVTTILLNEGNNTVNLNIVCTQVGTINTNDSLISINDIPITIEKKEIEVKSVIKLDIESQNNILQIITDVFIEFNKTKNSKSIHAIKGNSGIGKTFLIEKLLKTHNINDYDVVYQSFSKEPTDNQILLVNIVVSLMFYYLPANYVNNEYLQNLINENFFISNTLLNLVKARDESIENLASYMQKYSKNGEIFPSMVHLNKKVLILDDLHKLDNISRSFLFSLIEDINNSKLNFFIVLVGRNQFWNNTDFVDFFKSNFFKFYSFEFSANDVFSNLKKYDVCINKRTLMHIEGRVKFNAILTIKMIQYLRKKGKKFLQSLNSETQFSLIYQFATSDEYSNTILSEFEILTNQTQKELVNIVYFSLSGIDKDNIKGHFLEILSRDLSHLVKRQDGKFVPIHDIYEEIYKKKYTPIAKNILKKYLIKEPKYYENIRYSLLTDDEDWDNIVEKILILERKHQFFTIKYILDPIFDEQANIKLDNNKFPIRILFKLQLLYARAVGNCSKHNSGQSCYSKLYNDIKQASIIHWNDKESINNVFEEVIAELANSCFERLQFNKVQQYVNEYDKCLNLSIKNGYNTALEEYNKPSFLLIKEIELLSSLALDNFENHLEKLQNFIQQSKKANNYDKVDIMKIRFARSILHQNSNIAYQNIQEAVKSIKKRKSNEEKWILLGEFEMTFIDFQNAQNPVMKDIYISHDKLKENFFNDYRKGYLVVAACALSLGLKEEMYANLQHCVMKREMRPRLKGWYLQLLALYEYCFENNAKDAIQYLKEQKQIFKSLGCSYHKVIEHNLQNIQNKIPNQSINFFVDDRLVENSLMVDTRLW